MFYLHKPCIYHPSLVNNRECWLQQYYPQHEISRNQLSSSMGQVIEQNGFANYDHNIICAEPYFLPVPWKPTIPTIILAGDFHHQEASISELIVYIRALSRISTRVFVVSSCQPWLSRVLEEIINCTALDYIEIPYNLGGRLDGEIDRTESNENLANQNEVCISPSIWQPKRSIYIWNLLRLEFPESKIHPRQSKENWVRQLSVSRGPYRVPTISGQLSPQITYPALYGRSVISDINVAVQEFFKDKAIGNMLSLYPLTAEWKDREYKKLDANTSSQEKFQSNVEKIKSSLSAWIPGMTEYKCEKEQGDASSDTFDVQRILWTFDILTALKAKSYIGNVVIEESENKVSITRKALLSFSSAVDKSVRGTPRINVKITGNGAAMEIQESCSMVIVKITRSDARKYLEIVNRESRIWREVINSKIHLA